MPTRAHFRDMYFGLASAEAEVAENPKRFLESYFDRWELQRSIDKYPFFLVLGPKGSGKSAVSQFIQHTLRKRYGDDQTFCATIYLDEVSPGMSPLSAVTRKLVSEEASVITDSAWRLFISVRLLELVLRDQGSALQRDPRIANLQADLGRLGLLTRDFPTVLKKVRERKTSINLKVINHEWGTKSDVVPIDHLGEEILQLILDVESSGHFVLTIDGLDRIIVDNEAYWLTLAALLRVADSLRRKLLRAQADIRLYVMCRSDVFREIRFADADKIAGDASIFVDWGSHQTRPADSPLWDYLAAKANVSPENLFALLPQHVTVGARAGNARKIPVAEYLIQSTRSTPREMTLLMKRLQDETPRSGYLNEDRIRAGVDGFSSHDLLTAVAAESTGLLNKELQSHLEGIISSLPCATNLTRADFEQASREVGVSSELVGELLEFLFLAGLIGNLDPQTGYIQFSYRRDTHKFRRNGPWILHRGLMYAFNIPYARTRR